MVWFFTFFEFWFTNKTNARGSQNRLPLWRIDRMLERTCHFKGVCLSFTEHDWNKNKTISVKQENWERSARDVSTNMKAWTNTPIQQMQKKKKTSIFFLWWTCRKKREKQNIDLFQIDIVQDQWSNWLQSRCTSFGNNLCQVLIRFTVWKEQAWFSQILAFSFPSQGRPRWAPFAPDGHPFFFWMQQTHILAWAFCMFCWFQTTQMWTNFHNHENLLSARTQFREKKHCWSFGNVVLLDNRWAQDCLCCIWQASCQSVLHAVRHVKQETIWSWNHWDAFWWFQTEQSLDQKMEKTFHWPIEMEMRESQQHFSVRKVESIELHSRLSQIWDFGLTPLQTDFDDPAFLSRMSHLKRNHALFCLHCFDISLCRDQFCHFESVLKLKDACCSATNAITQFWQLKLFSGLGESLRLSPVSRQSSKLSPETGESFRGESFNMKDVWHFFTCVQNSPLNQGRVLKLSPKSEQSSEHILKLSPKLRGESWTALCLRALLAPWASSCCSWASFFWRCVCISVYVALAYGMCQVWS